MKKNIDPNKVSSFKNTEMSYHKHSTFCMKTKPNNRYFNGEVKRLTQEMKNDLCTEELKQKDPALYFSLLGKKMPKKYLKLYETKAETKEVKVPVSTEIKKIKLKKLQKTMSFWNIKRKGIVKGQSNLKKIGKKTIRASLMLSNPLEKILIEVCDLSIVQNQLTEED